MESDLSHGGRRGGLGLLLNDELHMTILSSSLHYINALVNDSNREKVWRFCGIYGWAGRSNKHLTWQLMRQLKDEWDNNWLCIGDFNEVCYNFEKMGGTVCDLDRMEELWLAIEDCRLFDLGYNGHKFTSTNNQVGSNHIEERRGQFVASKEWMSIFGNYTVEHHFASLLIIVLFSWKCGHEEAQNDFFFRLEAMWFKEESFMQTCRDAWYEQFIVPKNSSDLQKKVTNCGWKLKTWEKVNFGNITRQIRILLDELKKLMSGYNSIDAKEKRKRIEMKIDDLFEKEEVIWKQRSQALWLQDKDKSMTYFHMVADDKNRRNQISKITDSAGVVHTKVEEVQLVFRYLFEELFTSQGNNDMDEVSSAI